jgi:hypothetical protein
MKLTIKDILLVAGIGVIIYLLLIPNEIKEIVNVQQVVEIQKDTVTVYKEKVIEKIKYIKVIHNQIDTLKADLVTIKHVGIDSVTIAQQDTIIDVLTVENKELYNVVSIQDSTIIKLDEIDIIRVEQIDLLIKDNKKTKRRLVGTAIIGGLIVLLQIFRK